MCAIPTTGSSIVDNLLRQPYQEAADRTNSMYADKQISENDLNNLRIKALTEIFNSRQGKGTPNYRAYERNYLENLQGFSPFKGN